MRKIDIMAMGQRLKEVRTRSGMTQEDLAELAGIDPKSVYRLENERVMMRLDNLVRIAEILDVTLDYLVYGRTDRDPLSDVLILNISTVHRQYLHKPSRNTIIKAVSS